MKILAIRPLAFPEENKVAQSIHKILKAGTFYYFYDGVEIIDNRIVVENKCPENLYK